MQIGEEKEKHPARGARCQFIIDFLNCNLSTYRSHPHLSFRPLADETPTAPPCPPLTRSATLRAAKAPHGGVSQRPARQNGAQRVGAYFMQSKTPTIKSGGFVFLAYLRLMAAITSGSAPSRQVSTGSADGMAIATAATTTSADRMRIEGCACFMRCLHSTTPVGTLARCCRRSEAYESASVQHWRSEALGECSVASMRDSTRTVPACQWRVRAI